MPEFTEVDGFGDLHNDSYDDFTKHAVTIGWRYDLYAGRVAGTAAACAAGACTTAADGASRSTSISVRASAA